VSISFCFPKPECEPNSLPQPISITRCLTNGVSGADGFAKPFADSDILDQPNALANHFWHEIPLPDVLGQ
jgi:hypothetical protein